MGSSDDRATVRTFASKGGYHVTVLSSLDEAKESSTGLNAALVILDRDLPDRDSTKQDWRPTVRSFAQHDPVPAIILVSAVIDDYLFDELVKQGGFDIMPKPLHPDELRRICGLALTFWKNRLARKLSG